MGTSQEPAAISSITYQPSRCWLHDNQTLIYLPTPLFRYRHEYWLLLGLYFRLNVGLKKEWEICCEWARVGGLCTAKTGLYDWQHRVLVQSDLEVRAGLDSSICPSAVHDLHSLLNSKPICHAALVAPSSSSLRVFVARLKCHFCESSPSLTSVILQAALFSFTARHVYGDRRLFLPEVNPLIT